MIRKILTQYGICDPKTVAFFEVSANIFISSFMTYMANIVATYVGDLSSGKTTAVNYWTVFLQATLTSLLSVYYHFKSKPGTELSTPCESNTNKGNK